MYIKSNLDKYFNKDYILKEENLYFNYYINNNFNFKNIYKKDKIIDNILSEKYIKDSINYINGLDMYDKILLNSYTENLYYLINSKNNKITEFYIKNYFNIIKHFCKKELKIIFKTHNLSIKLFDNIIIDTKYLSILNINTAIIKNILLNRIKKIIHNAPKLDKDIILYRGTNIKNKLENIQSFSLLSKTAISFIDNCLNLVKVLKNTPILILINVSKIKTEYEALLDINLNYINMDNSIDNIKPQILTLYNKYNIYINNKYNKNLTKVRKIPIIFDKDLNYITNINFYMYTYSNIYNKTIYYKINNKISLDTTMFLYKLLPYCKNKNEYLNGYEIYKNVIIYEDYIYLYYIITNFLFEKENYTINTIKFNKIYNFFKKNYLSKNILLNSINMIYRLYNIDDDIYIHNFIKLDIFKLNKISIIIGLEWSDDKKNNILLIKNINTINNINSSYIYIVELHYVNVIKIETNYFIYYNNYEILDLNKKSAAIGNNCFGTLETTKSVIKIIVK